MAHRQSSSTEPKENTGPKVPIWLFVNPSSGGNKAAAFTDIGKEIVDLDVLQDCGVLAELHIYNIKEGKPGDKPGFKKLKAFLDEDEQKGQAPGDEVPLTRVVVGGGDGTVMWTIIEMNSHKIDTTKVAVGVVPFGTGNDFSRTLGWGGYPPKQLVGQDYAALKQHVRRWLDADLEQHDIWEVTVTTHEAGNFLFVQEDKTKGLTDGQRMQHHITDLPGGGMHMVKPLCNYYSFGWDPQAGLGFDKRRTKSQFKNILVYAHEGVKKQVPWKKPPRIDQTMNFMGALKTKDAVLRTNEKKPANPEDIVVKCSVGKQEGSQGVLSGTPIDIIALNIPSFAKGCNLWGCSSNVGLLDANGKKMPQNNRKEILNQTQKLGDGCLNVLSFKYIGGLNFDVVKGQAGIRSGPGTGSRLYQGPEDIIFDFKDPDKAKYRKDGRVYMQIDGEFFIARFPSQVVIRHKLKLNVLRNTEPLPGKCSCAGGGGHHPQRHGAGGHRVQKHRTKDFGEHIEVEVKEPEPGPA